MAVPQVRSANDDELGTEVLVQFLATSTIQVKSHGPS